MKKLLSVSIFLFIVNCAFAQQPPIMVCNATGTSCTPYHNLDTAIVAASPGSYIYLPGGSFKIISTINKEIHLIGTGHYPDSTNVTGVSQITTAIYLSTGAANSSFEGLYGVNNISSHPSVSGNINNIIVTKCNIHKIAGTGFAVLNNVLIKDCVIREAVEACTHSVIKNSILRGCIPSSISYSEIENCILTPIMSNISNSTLKNNIFDSLVSCSSSPMPFLGCTNCYFYNNMTIFSSLNASGATFETGTLVNVPYSNLYLNSTTKEFNYTKDFHLKTTSPGHNAGTDGTDIGIYGGTMPYTNGAVPGNPHMFYKTVNGTTNSVGNLPVNIKTRTGQ